MVIEERNFGERVGIMGNGFEGLLANVRIFLIFFFLRYATELGVSFAKPRCFLAFVPGFVVGSRLAYWKPAKISR
jgi:hypothetical protein